MMREQCSVAGEAAKAAVGIGFDVLEWYRVCSGLMRAPLPGQT